MRPAGDRNAVSRRVRLQDKRCYGVTRDDLGNDMPPEPNAFLNAHEIDAVVQYLFAKVVGRGDSTYEECVEFWGKDTRQWSR